MKPDKSDCPSSTGEHEKKSNTIIKFARENVGFFDRRNKSWQQYNDALVTSKSQAPDDVPVDGIVYMLGNVDYNQMLIGPIAVLKAKNVPRNYGVRTIVTIPMETHGRIALNFDLYSEVLEFVEKIKKMLSLDNRVLCLKDRESIVHLERLRKWVAEGKNQHVPSHQQAFEEQPPLRSKQ